MLTPLSYNECPDIPKYLYMCSVWRFSAGETKNWFYKIPGIGFDVFSRPLITKLNLLVEGIQIRRIVLIHGA
jgi:hypothetical protein